MLLGSFNHDFADWVCIQQRLKVAGHHEPATGAISKFYYARQTPINRERLVRGVPIFLIVKKLS